MTKFPEKPTLGLIWDDEETDTNYWWNGIRWQNLHRRPTDQAILTHSGRMFWSLQPHQDDFYLDDFATSLDREYRFANHTISPYSVAHHSWALSYLVPKHLAKWALIHDIPESMMRDLPRPIKRLFPEYGRAETRLMTTIAEWLGMEETEEPEELKPWDIWISHIELGALFPQRVGRAKLKIFGYSDEYLDSLKKYEYIVAMPGDFKQRWLDRFRELFHDASMPD